MRTPKPASELRPGDLVDLEGDLALNWFCITASMSCALGAGSRLGTAIPNWRRTNKSCSANAG
jgi:hypothetical protein